VVPHVRYERKEIKDETDLLREGSWQYMPGSRVTHDGLEILRTDMAILNKRKSKLDQGEYIYEPNPPLNMYGPRLRAEGDFAVAARLQGGAASFSAYAAAPLRFDDFRFERSRVELYTKKGSLQVAVWDGSSQEPIAHASFKAANFTDDRQVELRREGNDLWFLVNGTRAGTLPYGRIFDTGEVWLGVTTENPKIHVAEIIATRIGADKLEVVDTSTLRITERTPDALQSLVDSSKLLIGTAASLNFMSDPRYAQLVLGGHVGRITIENEMKPQDIQPREGHFEFGQADALIDLARRNGVKKVHGHTAIYSKAMPEWMTELSTETEADKQRVKEVFVAHLKAFATHFKGRLYSCDVMNELISEGFGNNPAKFEDNIFLRAMGEECIDIAFRTVHEIDPDMRLYLNDNGIEVHEGRRRFMEDLLERLVARGVPVHGLGIQGHVYEIPRDTITLGSLRRWKDFLDQHNLEMHISEMDVTGKDEAEQAKQYRDVATFCRDNNVDLTFWGLSDAYGSTVSLQDNGRLKPGTSLLYDTSFWPKAAFAAVYRALR
jgi:endo-1,4-beta-xylanase